MAFNSWKKKLTHLTAAVLVVALLGGCGGTAPQGREEHQHESVELQPASLSAGEKLKVVATTNIVGSVVGQVGGEHIELTTLMGIGIDPHSYVPTPADTAVVHDAHVVFANGLGLESNLEEMLENAGGGAVEIHLSDGLALRERQGAQGEGEPNHKHDNIDPHVWFDVRNVIHWVEIIQDALSALDPASAEAYRANAEAYAQELEALDAWIVAQVAMIPEGNRRLVTNHPAFGYLAGRYGLEQVGTIYPISPSSEPSAQDIAALEDAIHKYGVPAVFTESTVNPKLAEQVARDTGIPLVPLYSGSLGRPGSGVESYIELIRYDVRAIVDALR
ncbi:MAG: metal ABC transporter substrate-binding protein [Anaerolineae bacterium]|jgi:ABC-type Zn uptake system ZnuABC Zn-binding protein ZnuA